MPIESVKTEYKDKYVRDSIHYYDSIYVKEKGDTILFEKYRYIYKDKLITDTILSVDSIRVPYPVIEVQEVNKLTSFQSFEIWCGRILLFLLLCFFGFKLLKRFVL